MKLELAHKQYCMKRDGYRDVAERIKIQVERSDDVGMTKMEIFTALKIMLDRLENDIRENPHEA